MPLTLEFHRISRRVRNENITSTLKTNSNLHSSVSHECFVAIRTVVLYVHHLVDGKETIYTSIAHKFLSTPRL